MKGELVKEVLINPQRNRKIREDCDLGCDKGVWDVIT